MRKLLMVVDSTPECLVALRYAARRARSTEGWVTMLYVIEPGEFEHWVSVRDVMRQEARAEAEERLLNLAAEVYEYACITPEFVIREGKTHEEVLGLIGEDAEIRALVLGASAGGDGPGPLVTELVGHRSAGLHIPIVVVPGCMTDQEIDLDA